MTKKKKIAVIIIFVICALAVHFVSGIWILSAAVYNMQFNNRYESYEPLKLYLEDFDGLESTQYKFPSDKGQMLTGYMYSSGGDQRGIVVMAHGFGGGGHNSYLNCIDCFAKNGYYVFAFDATGCDESEGEGLGGLPQGVSDLDRAISFVKQNEDFPDLPIVLFGHSWGGYCADSVLKYHSDVKAVISCAGFNSSSDMFEFEGKQQAGEFIYLMMPFVNLHERINYGKYAENTAMDGFAATDASVMIVHSKDDDVLPPEVGYDVYYDKYKDDPRFDFILLEDKGHNCFCDDTYVNEFNAGFDDWLDTLDYDYLAEENKERFIADKADYINKNLDRKRWCNRLDTDMFERFIEFYDSNIE